MRGVQCDGSGPLWAFARVHILVCQACRGYTGSTFPKLFGFWIQISNQLKFGARRSSARVYNATILRIVDVTQQTQVIGCKKINQVTQLVETTQVRHALNQDNHMKFGAVGLLQAGPLHSNWQEPAQERHLDIFVLFFLPDREGAMHSGPWDK